MTNLLFFFSSGSKTNFYRTDESKSEILYVIAGVDRYLTFELTKETIVVLEAGVNTKIMTKCTTNGKKSKVVFIAGVNNSVEGLENQHRGKFTDMRGNEVCLSSLVDFKDIRIEK